MTFLLHNTEKKQLVEVKPQNKNTLTFYTCGPTVYNYAHIGNFRTFVFEDLLRRSLKYYGYKVEQVLNITDVDDKTIQGALSEKVPLKTYTERYKNAFFDDCKELNIEPVEHTPLATDYIPDMVKMCETLIEKGCAYTDDKEDKSVYFAISKYADYGKLSHLKLDELQEGATKSLHADEYTKENAQDFVLWKGYDKARDGDIYWESPFGKGRPGWHLECSAMAQKILGESIDLHAGGVDLIFPHHENEIAQSECCSGKHFCNHWVHAEHLLVEGKKMSKSAGNFYTLRDLLEKGYSGKEIRFLFLQTHYRVQLNFTFQSLDGARHALNRIRDFLCRLEAYDEKGDESCVGIVDHYRVLFKKALGNDLNMSEAMAHIFDFIRKINALCDEKALSNEGAKCALSFMKEVDSVLAVFPETTVEVPDEILQLVVDRQKARKDKDFKRADQIRDEITSKGFILEDSAKGPVVKRKL